MTREEARKAAEVMKAYAEGKDVEYKEVYNGDKLWHSPIGNDPVFDWYHNDYRIKKEPTYRPFKNAKECWEEMLQHQPFGWILDDNHLLNIVDIDNNGIVYLHESDIHGLDYLDYTDSLKYMRFADGIPFGISIEILKKE